MRLPLLALAMLALCTASVAAWSKEDQEIFRLRDEVEAAEGLGVSFYDFLGITPAANQDDINKAYKKRSRTLHPDKVKQTFIASKAGAGQPGAHGSKGPTPAEIKATAKAASDRFARLGIVTNILRGAGRERYDHFLNNGFPKWKGTGYYYARFRPGLGSVLAGLFIFVGGGGHWLALYMSWKRQQDFVGRYIKFARHAAWGDNLGIPGLDSAPPADENVDPATAQPLNRKMRRMQEKGEKKDRSDKKSKGARAAKAGPPATGAAGPRKRVVAENGKILVVDAVGNVYLEQANEDGEMQEFLLDPNELAQPTLRDTALVRVPLWIVRTAGARFLAAAPSADAESELEDDEEVPSPSSSSGADDFEVLERSKTTASHGNGKAVRRKKSVKGR